MKLLSFVVLICISLKCLSAQIFSNYVKEVKEVKNSTLEEQIHELQNKVELMFKYLNLSQLIPKEDPKEMFFKSLSKKEKESLLCFKEIYLLRRGQIENFANAKLMTRSKLRKELKMEFTNFSSQLTEDLIDSALNYYNDEAICHTFGDMLSQLKLWGVKQFILNATYVEQKMKDFANEMGQENYAFLRENYNECLELFQTDLSQKLASDTVSGIISLYRMIYGNRTEVETALSYLYGSRHYTVIYND